ncbi:MAG: Hsp20/alpha crystallin family protein [Bacteroidetes bacterium]|nr:Hsp20/alpha crystallin family protein [Bacteroidota bacterium]
MNIETGESNQVPLKKICSCSSCLRIDEKESEYIISMCLTGLKRQDISIHVEKNMLKISSKNDAAGMGESAGPLQYETHQLKHSFALPSDADANSASANFEKNRLMIHFPKHDKPYRPPMMKIHIS